MAYFSPNSLFHISPQKIHFDVSHNWRALPLNQCTDPLSSCQYPSAAESSRYKKPGICQIEQQQSDQPNSHSQVTNAAQLRQPFSFSFDAIYSTFYNYSTVRNKTYVSTIITKYYDMLPTTLQCWEHISLTLSDVAVNVISYNSVCIGSDQVLHGHPTLTSIYVLKTWTCWTRQPSTPKLEVECQSRLYSSFISFTTFIMGPG